MKAAKAACSRVGGSHADSVATSLFCSKRVGAPSPSRTESAAAPSAKAATSVADEGAHPPDPAVVAAVAAAVASTQGSRADTKLFHLPAFALPLSLLPTTASRRPRRL